MVNDQKRLRENLAGLKETAEEKTLRKRYADELSSSEDALAALRKQITDLNAQHNEAKKQLNKAIENLHFDEEG